MALAVEGPQAGSYAVSGALSLYLDFINLFLTLLRLFGNRRELEPAAHRDWRVADLQPVRASPPPSAGHCASSAASSGRCWRSDITCGHPPHRPLRVGPVGERHRHPASIQPSFLTRRYQPERPLANTVAIRSGRRCRRARVLQGVRGFDTSNAHRSHLPAVAQADAVLVRLGDGQVLAERPRAHVLAQPLLRATRA